MVVLKNESTCLQLKWNPFTVWIISCAAELGGVGREQLKQWWEEKISKTSKACKQEVK